MCTAEFHLSYVDVLSLLEELDLYVLLIPLAVMWLSAGSSSLTVNLRLTIQQPLSTLKCPLQIEEQLSQTCLGT